MPLAIPQRLLQREALGSFLGVNLRKDPLSMADGDVVRSMNADMHLQPGILRPRKGRTALSSTTLPFPVTLVTSQAGTRYQVAGQVLYSNFSALISTLGAGSRTTLEAFRPLNDTTEWVFVANTALTPLMRKVTGATVRNWGITAPSAAPTLASGGAGSLTGVYGYRYTYCRFVGSALAHESSPSPLGATFTASSNTLSIPVVASSDAQVTHIRGYRTVAGGSAYLLDQTISNASTTLTSSIADTALGAAVESDNTPPPPCSFVVPFQEHLFLLGDPSNPHYLWYSRRFRPESVPTDQFLEIGTPSVPLQTAVPLTGLLGVFTAVSKYRVFGNAVSGFTALEALSTRGTPAPQAVLATTRGAIFPARDGLFASNFVEQDQELTQAIQPLFYGETVNDYAPIDWDSATSMSLCEFKRRLYFGYVDTNAVRMLAVLSADTGQWYFYQHPVQSLFWEESTDQLLMGGTDGVVYVLETGTQDSGSDIAMTATLPTRALQDRFVRKRFDYMRVDAAVPSGTLTVGLYIDGTLRTTKTITGTRTRRLLRLPEGLMGYTWHAVVTYTGSAAAAVYAVEVQAITLGSA